MNGFTWLWVGFIWVKSLGGDDYEVEVRGYKRRTRIMSENVVGSSLFNCTFQMILSLLPGKSIELTP
jgi:hypothetical protein